MQRSDLSIIIPVACQDTTWKLVITELESCLSEVEILIIGCEAAPQDFVFPANVRWHTSRQGRALQMNTGARLARGSVFWFVHADTRLNARIIESLTGYLKHHTPGIAFFKLRFADDGPLLTRLNAWMANVRSSLFKLPFGDQGFVIDKSVFEQLHGFDETLRIGEDLDFIVRLNASGFQNTQLPGTLTTSARRYRQQGWVNTTLRHLWLTCQLTYQAKQRLKLT